MSVIGKHLVEVSQYYGSLWERGVVVSETEKTWLTDTGSGDKRRVHKASNIIPTDAGGMDRAKATLASTEAECKRLEAAAVEARRAQRQAVYAALASEASSHV